MLKISAVYSSVVLFSLLLCGGRLLYEQYYGDQGCEMTWMYMWPRYLKVPMSQELEDAHPQYGLYLYTESQEKEGGPSTLTGSLSGVPALFIPGNAGSHKQARSSASIALRMHLAEFKHLHHFDFFTVKLNEELSGVFGGVLQRQVEYVASCINHILRLYAHLPTRPGSVVIIAHSMGGVVARALFTLADFNSPYVHTIIAMASPLQRPVISLDPLLQEFYDRISNKVGVVNVTLVSLAGGERDIMVPTFLSSVPHAINLAAPAVPRNWVSADHQAIVWCRRVQLALTRALFLMQDPSGRELTRDNQYKEKILRHLLLHGREVPHMATPTSVIQIKSSSVVMTNGTNEGNIAYRHEGKSVRNEYVGLVLSGRDPVLVTSNTGRGSWVFVCETTDEQNAKQLNCTDLSSEVSLLPPKLGVVKSLLVLPSNWMEGKTLLVLAQPSNIHQHSPSKGFLIAEQCHAHTREVQLHWFGGSLTVPPSHCTLMNFSLPELELWHTYTAFVSSCGEVRAALVVPWYPHTPLTHSPPSHLHKHHNITMSLSVMLPSPANPTAPPHLLVWAPSHCPLNITIYLDPLELIDKLSVVYFPLLLPWVTAVCIASSGWGVGLEIVSITVLYAFASNGWIPYTDWQLLSSSRVWNGLVPIVLHLIARVLRSSLAVLVRVGVVIIRKICGRGNYFGWVCLLLSVPCLWLCSGLGVACLLVGLASKAISKQSVDVLCVLVCLQILTLPAVVSWIKGLGFVTALSPDPHFSSVLAIICITMVMMWWTQSSAVVTSRGGSNNRYTVLEACLAMLTLLYCVVHMYRITTVIVVYLSLCTVKHITLLK